MDDRVYYQGTGILGGRVKCFKVELSFSLTVFPVWSVNFEIFHTVALTWSLRSSRNFLSGRRSSIRRPHSVSLLFFKVEYLYDGDHALDTFHPVWITESSSVRDSPASISQEIESLSSLGRITTSLIVAQESKMIPRISD